MASAIFDEKVEEKKPTVQVGDPFTEKLLLEACLELMADDSIDFDDPMNVVEMWNDQFNSEEWFNSLHTCDKPVVNKVLMNLLPSKVKII